MVFGECASGGVEDGDEEACEREDGDDAVVAGGRERADACRGYDAEKGGGESRTDDP